MAHLKLFFASFFASACGHGYLESPIIRGRYNEFQYEPQSLGAAGPGHEIAACGFTTRQRDEPITVPIASDVKTRLTAGAPHEFVMKLTAHHMGHMTVKLCPYFAGGQNVNLPADCVDLLRSVASHEACADSTGYKSQSGAMSDDCQPIDASNPGYWYLSPGTAGAETAGKRMTFDIPVLDDLPDSPSGLYTIQWRWNSANSCLPDVSTYGCYFDTSGDFWTETEVSAGGTWFPNQDSFNSLNCGSSIASACGAQFCCSEVFTNCADVHFVDEAELDLSLVPDAPTGNAVDTDAGTDANTGSAPSSGSGTGCVKNPSCEGGNLWCADPSYAAWCPQHLVSNCPTPQCMIAVSEVPEPEPEPESEPEDTSESAPKVIGHNCSPSNAAIAANFIGLQAFCSGNTVIYGADSILSVGADLCICTPILQGGLIQTRHVATQVSEHQPRVAGWEGTEKYSTKVSRKMVTSYVSSDGGVVNSDEPLMSVDREA